MLRFLPCGERAVLVELDDAGEREALVRSLQQTPIEAVVDVVPGARTVLLTTHARTDPATVVRAVRERDLTPGGPRDAAAEVTLEVVYDGPDLAEVAALTGLRAAEVVEAHTGQLWTVAFCGFSPGFGYLTGSDDRLHVPRRTTPRTRVEPGSVGLAGEYSGVYPAASPGGWQLLGRTAATLWDVAREPPALLAPGTRVRFRAVGTGDG